MVKGVSRRVIVVRNPDDGLFSEAIFILNESALCGNIRDSEAVLREACAVADDFVLKNCGDEQKPHLRKLIRPLVMSNLILLTLITFVYLLFLN